MSVLLLRKPDICFLSNFKCTSLLNRATVLHISCPVPTHSVPESQAQNPLTLFLNTGTLWLLSLHVLSNSTSDKSHSVYSITPTILDFIYKYEHKVFTFYCLTYFI